MAKRTVFFILALTLIIFNLSASGARNLKEEKDFAVPAFSDFFVLGGTKISIHPINPEEENGLLPGLGEIRRLDINRDLQLNDFDIKQFEAVIEELGGVDLSARELIAQFGRERENQAALFPLIYDLDRDGKFTPYDVDYFSELVGSLDSGSIPDSEAAIVNGSELVKVFRNRIFPETEKGTGR